MTLEEYLEMYNKIAKARYDARKERDPVDYHKYQAAEALRLVVREMAQEQNVGICWGSYGATIDNRLRPLK